jgi:PPOX class probable F420-dependent enzyme
MKERDAHIRRAAAPRTSRPVMPGYGIVDANSGKGLLPWDWAVEHLTKSRNYWVATTWPNGRPHCVPVWGVWLDDTFYFSSGERSRKARNLAADPRCVICPENGDEAISLEGVAETVSDDATIARIVAAYNPKYKQDLTVESVKALGLVYAVRPRKVLAFNDAPGDFQTTATRWEFD